MKKLNNFFLIFILIFIYSCGSKKTVLYLQDIESETNLNIEYIDYILKVDDILKIDVTVESPELSLFLKNTQSSFTLSSKESFLYSGYKIDTNGNINYPSLGSIKAEGLTISQLSTFIEELIIKNGILIQPSVDIKLINAHFSVLGEVNRPGRYDFLKNNLNVLEALGMAGDLTINGKRSDIKIIREINEKKIILKLDLTQSKFLDSDAYQIFSGDIIIVDPNTTRVKNAGIIGNSGTLISLLSFVLSSIIVISNNN